MKHSGWRKPTPGLCKASSFAKVGEQLTVSKNQAMLAVKRVASTIGIKPGDLLLLDTLVAFTKPKDWEKGSRPIVWPSNEYLMEQTGYSRTGMKMCLRRLGEYGLIAFKDSSNGKRWGHRDDSGRIVEAYGFDLAPLAARAGEFEALFSELQEERMLCKGLKRKITIARRSIRSMLENALSSAQDGATDDFKGTDWKSMWSRFQALLDTLPGRKVASERLLDLYDAFAELKVNVECGFKGLAQDNEMAGNPSPDGELEVKYITNNTQNTDPSRSKKRPHILVTKQLHPVDSNINEKQNEKIDSLVVKPLTGVNQTASSTNFDTGSSIDIPTIMSSCPNFAEMARGVHDYIRDWKEFLAVADTIRPMIGISADAWEKAQAGMGPIGAAAAIALITDKYSEGEVQSPGGYLRGLVTKAEQGELHLARSFYGRLNEQVRV